MNFRGSNVYLTHFNPPVKKLDIEELKDVQSDATSNDSHRIECLERELKEKDVLIEQLLEQINQMKSGFHAWVERTDTNARPLNSEQLQPPQMNGEDVDDAHDEEPSHVAKIPMKDDESYFMSYAHFNIHYDMLSVSMRTAIGRAMKFDYLWLKSLKSSNLIFFSGFRSYKQLP